MKKCWLLILFLFCFLPLEGKKLVLFEKPEQGAKYLIAPVSVVSFTGKSVRNAVQYNNLVHLRHFSEVRVAGKITGYYSPDFEVNPGGGSVRLLRRFPSQNLWGIILFCCAGAVLLFRGIRKGMSDWILCLLPVCLRCLLVLLTAGLCENLVPAATDEPGYFKTISDMLNGEWRDQWAFTVGTGFFYLPFILFTGAKEFYDIVPAFNFFSALILAPGTLILGYLILRKWQISNKTACFAMLIWSIYPFISLHLEDWNTLNFQQFFHYPQWFSSFNGHFYYSFCINSGFNAMSDVPGLLLVMGCLYMTLAMPEKIRFAALFGALYGFACLVRINYILLAPLFAYILWNRFEFKKLFSAAAASAGTFLAVFSIQLVCNTLQFGSPFTFGYVLHYTQNAALDRPIAGFTWHTFSQWKNLCYLFKVNLPVFALGVAALWVMRDRFKQTVLILLCVPLVLFFCGYSHTFCDARRFVFPAFAGFLMAAAAWDGWKLSRREICAVIFSLGTMLLLTVPACAYWKGLPFMLGQGIFLRSMSAAVPLLLLGVIWGFIRRKSYRTAVFVFLSAFFFYAPTGFLAVGMFLLLPLILFRHAESYFRTNSAPGESSIF